MDKLAFAAEFVENLPSSAARSLEGLRAEDVSTFVDQIPDALSSKALQHMLPHHAAQCLLALPPTNASRYLAPLPISGIAAILRHVPPTGRQELIDGLPRGAARRIGRLLDFPRTVVGWWTNVDVVTLPEDCTIGDARQRIRAADSDAPAEMFVINQDQALTGSVWIGALAAARDENKIQEIVNPVGHSISATALVHSAIGDAAWNHADVLPVVDQSELFMGTLRHRDLRHALAGIVADQRVRSDAGMALNVADTWFVAMATILEAFLAPASEEKTTE